MVLTSVGLSLIALAAGMFLLAKTMKDNLGRFFKFIAYFIVIVSLLNIVGSALRGAAKGYYMHHYYKGIMNYRDGDMPFHHGMWDYGHDGRFGSCCPPNKGCNMGGMHNCCKGMMKDSSSVNNK